MLVEVRILLMTVVTVGWVIVRVCARRLGVIVSHTLVAKLVISAMAGGLVRSMMAVVAVVVIIIAVAIMAEVVVVRIVVVEGSVLVITGWSMVVRAVAAAAIGVSVMTVASAAMMVIMTVASAAMMVIMTVAAASVVNMIVDVAAVIHVTVGLRAVGLNATVVLATVRGAVVAAVR